MRLERDYDDEETIGTPTTEVDSIERGGRVPIEGN